MEGNASAASAIPGSAQGLPALAGRALLAWPRPGARPGAAHAEQLSHRRPAGRRDRHGDHAPLPRAARARCRAYRRAGAQLRDAGRRRRPLPRDRPLDAQGDARAVAARADAILLCAMGLPEVRYPDGREIAPQLELRFEYGLYAGVRPVRPIPGVRPILADPRAHEIDYVIVRESTEGLFRAPGAGRDHRGPRGARDAGADPADLREALRLLLSPGGRARAPRRSPRPQGHACRQGERLSRLSLGARHLLRARARLSGGRGRARLCRRIRHAHGAKALDD